jgi:AraC family transcriptional regulator
MQLSIKNMVCDRCIAAVDRLLKEQGLHPVTVRLGEATIAEDEIDTETLRATLKSAGFALLDDRKSRLVERVKNTIIRLVHHTGEPPRHKYSQLIAADTGHEYPYLSKLFSESEGTTIEQFLLRQKIEKVKEYLGYEELTLSEIAETMGYSSVAHLSAQFRKVTGMSPTEYKSQKDRTPLDRLG